MGFVVVSLLATSACQRADCPDPDVITPRMDLAPGDTERSRAMMIGKWYLEQPRSDGTTVRAVSTMHADSTLELVFQVVYPNGAIDESIETGLWGVSGDIYFTIIREIIYEDGSEDVSPEDPSKYLAYRVLALTENSFEYQTIVTGNRFRTTKVPDDFDLPRMRRAN